MSFSHIPAPGADVSICARELSELAANSNPATTISIRRIAPPPYSS